MFKVGGKLHSVLSVIFDLILVNILFCLLSVPIFTIGANITALCKVTRKIIEKENPSVLKSYFTCFKREFRQATILWLLLLGISGILILDYNISSNQLLLQAFVQPMLIAFGICAFISIFYCLQLVSFSKNSIIQLLKNGIVLAFGFLPISLLMILVTVGPVMLCALFFHEFLGIMGVIYLFIGMSLTALVDGLLFNRVIGRYVSVS